jgi:hypothetical protein
VFDGCVTSLILLMMWLLLIKHHFLLLLLRSESDQQTSSSSSSDWLNQNENYVDSVCLYEDKKMNECALFTFSMVTGTYQSLD